MFQCESGSKAVSGQKLFMFGLKLFKCVQKSCFCFNFFEKCQSFSKFGHEIDNFSSNIWIFECSRQNLHISRISQTNTGSAKKNWKMKWIKNFGNFLRFGAFFDNISGKKKKKNWKNWHYYSISVDISTFPSIFGIFLVKKKKKIKKLAVFNHFWTITCLFSQFLANW